MYDKGNIIGGLAVFLCLATFPVWYIAASGKADYRPDPVLPASENKCVESTQYMKEYHMQLLQQWRDSAVRDGVSIYVASDNTTYDIGLTGTCLKCHSNKSEFCDRCHNYTGVAPNCWNCHNIPPQPNTSLRGTP
jgi:hypothetical protein